MDKIEEIINAIDQYLEENQLESTTPKEIGPYLERRGLLNDDGSNPGKYLRGKLRKNQIPHAYQEGGKNSSWFIPHSLKGPFRNKSYLTKEQFKDALKNLANPKDIEILNAFLGFKDYGAHASQVSNILNEKHFGNINLHMGKLGNRIAKEYEISPKLREESYSKQYWNILFHGEYDDRQGFKWILRQELREAMVELGIDTCVFPGETPPPISDKKFKEGNTTVVSVNRHERNREARDQCINYYGAQCYICGLDFGESYGEFARGFIHVHHLNPIAQQDSPKEIDPKEDMVPLCPNCHAVVHLRRPEPYSLDEVKSQLANK